MIHLFLMLATVAQAQMNGPIQGGLGSNTSVTGTQNSTITWTGSAVFNNPVTFKSSVTVTASAFSVGASTLVVAGGNVGVSSSTPSALFVVGNGTLAVTSGGQTEVPDGSSTAPSFSFSANTNTGMYEDGSNLNFSYQGTRRFNVNAAALTLGTSNGIDFAGGGPFLTWQTGTSQAWLHMGAVNAASPVNQFLTVQGSRGGTDTNVSGGNLTLQSGLGTGNATGSTIQFATPDLQASGSTQQTATAKVTITGVGNVGISTTAPIGLFTVGASSGMVVLANGHTESFGFAPSISACGSAPAGSVVGNDNNGTITIGGGVVTACTLTFAAAWTNIPQCVISDNSTAVTPDVSAASASAFTASFSASLGGGLVYYQCRGYR